MKEVEFGEVDASELRVKPNLRGARARSSAPRCATFAPRCRRDASRRSTAAASAWTGTCSSPTRCSSSASARRAGRSRRDEGLTVALDTVLDDELRRERRVLDLIHQVNAMRREAGLELTDRIRLWIPDEDLLAYEERIKEDTLALSVEPGELRLEKA